MAWNLRRLRVARGLSQENLAVDAEIERTYLNPKLVDCGEILAAEAVKRGRPVDEVAVRSHIVVPGITERFDGLGYGFARPH